MNEKTKYNKKIDKTYSSFNQYLKSIIDASQAWIIVLCLGNEKKKK